eukprot:11075912-Lingulodinium_polyedra.AAC.1
MFGNCCIHWGVVRICFGLLLGILWDSHCVFDMFTNTLRDTVFQGVPGDTKNGPPQPPALICVRARFVGTECPRLSGYKLPVSSAQHDPPHKNTFRAHETPTRAKPWHSAAAQPTLSAAALVDGHLPG